jgi:6-phosphogluconate dehydrogenase
MVSREEGEIKLFTDYTRFRSRQEHTFAEKVLSAMRQKFGGHIERPAGG